VGGGGEVTLQRGVFFFWAVERGVWCRGGGGGGCGVGRLHI